jgi:hypothetical protein
MGSCRYALRAATPALQLPVRKGNVILGPVSQLATRPVGQLAARPVGCLSGWLPVRLVSRQSGRLIGHPSG